VHFNFTNRSLVAQGFSLILLSELNVEEQGAVKFTIFFLNKISQRFWVAADVSYLHIRFAKYLQRRNCNFGSG
jgi:hypothetical protein